jgi:hypothetical protein
MKSQVFAALILLWAASAAAQTASIRTEPLPPLQQQWQQQGTLPIQQAPAPGQLTTNPGQQPPAAQPPLAGTPAAPPPLANGPPATTERPNAWLPAETVKLQALDKVNAQTAALTIKVGASATFGSLTISAKACMVRPTDQPGDAAAFLTVTDSHPDSPGFNGWMLQDEPSVSMMEHPIYDLRVTGCT